jgi:2-C-methyl-D-erythritol 2,4-cyclodiphosphate synthase
VALEHPDGLGLEGHSDADVLLHALADALLGAAALGDIGQHFPNTDPQYRGISSLVLLARVAEAVRAAGWDVVNVDAMLLAERPRIRPHVDRMRQGIAEALEVEPGQVSVKATTNERLGFEGREEGMAAHAVATLRRAG